MRGESKNTKKKSYHIIFQQSANEMFFHEIIIEKLNIVNIAKNSKLCKIYAFIQFTRLLQKKEFDENILLSYISVD